MDAENRCILNCGGVRHETYKGRRRPEFDRIINLKVDL